MLHCYCFGLSLFYKVKKCFLKKIKDNLFANKKVSDKIVQLVSPNRSQVGANPKPKNLI